MTSTTFATAWPTRTANHAVAIIHEAHTATHRFSLSADGVLCIELNELRDESQDPEFIRATKDLPNYIALNEENIEALYRFLVSIEK